MDSEIVVYLISNMKRPLLIVPSLQTSYKMEQVERRRNMFVKRMKLRDRGEGIRVQEEKEEEEEEYQKDLFKIEQAGTYFIYRGEMHRAMTEVDKGKKEDLKRLIIDKGLEHMTGRVDTWVDKVLGKEKQQTLVVSIDLDGTLVGDDQAQHTFNLLWLKCFEFSGQHLLIYNTARDIEGVEHLLAIQHPFIWPEYMICQVGGVLMRMDHLGLTYIPDTHYTQQLLLHFPQTYLQHTLDNMSLLAHPLLKYYNPTNLWLRVSKDPNTHSQLLTQLQQLQQECKENNQLFGVLVGGDEQTVDIDITPQNGGKGQSLLYLLKQININKQSTCIMSLGDALTDLSMLLVSTIGVVQANSQSTLLYAQQSHPQLILSPYSFANAANHQLLSILAATS